MPRKRLIIKREAFVDPKYKNRLVAKFINCMMYKGKKSTAQSIIYKSFDIIKEKSKEDPLVLFEKGTGLLKELSGILEEAERKVEVLTREMSGSLVTEPFEEEEDE